MKHFFVYDDSTTALFCSFFHIIDALLAASCLVPPLHFQNSIILKNFESFDELAGWSGRCDVM